MEFYKIKHILHALVIKNIIQLYFKCYPFFKILFFVVLFSYPLLYVAYKYQVPNLANTDYFQYEKMIENPLDLKVTHVQWSTRQIPTLIAKCVKSCNLFYKGNKISFTYFVFDSGTNNRQINYFSFLISSYLGFVFSISLLLFLGGLQGVNFQNNSAHIISLVLGYFMTATNIISATPQSYAWLAGVIIICAISYQRSMILFLGLLIAVFSRESLLLFFFPFISLIIFIQYYKTSKINFYLLKVLLGMITSAILVFLIRYKFTDGTIGGVNNEVFSINNIFNLPEKFSKLSMDYFFQSFLTQGIVIYLLYKLYKKSSDYFIVFTFSYIFLISFCFLIGHGNNTGRIIGESFPVLIYFSCYNLIGPFKNVIIEN